MILNLSPGAYTVTVQSPGFKKYEHAGIVLDLQQQATLDVTLDVGQTSETVEVKGDVSAIETANSTFSDLVDNTQILNLPLNTRNVYSLIFLTPGLAGTIGNDYNSLSYSVNGARVNQHDTMVDGCLYLHAVAHHHRRYTPVVFPLPV